MTRPTRGELLHNFAYIALVAIRRTVSYRDAPYLFIVAIAPLLYVLRFRGLLKTPVGKLRIQRNDILRWSIYGLFKTRFYYTRMLDSTIFKNHARSTILDVGANLGDFAMANADKARTLVSVEPGHENFDILCSNLSINSLRQVVPLNLAAHDSYGKLSLVGIGADLRITKFNGGDHVSGAPLDSVLHNHGLERVDLAKIDVQGHELKVLRGLASYLKDHRIGLLIVEIHPNMGLSASDVVAFMDPMGYRLVATDHISGRPQMYFE